MKPFLMCVAIVAMCGFPSVLAVSQQAISTGGPLPDERGFTSKLGDPGETSRITVIVRHVAGQVYVVAGAGGNVVVFAGHDGILLVDTNFTVFYDQIMAAIRKVSAAPIRFVINTHAHPDHTQNNENMAMQGAVVFAHPNTRRAMMGTPKPGSEPPRGLPMVTSSEPLTFHFNGEEVSYVPLKPAHTDGDVGVYFHGSDVWAFGDEFTGEMTRIPVLRSGGSTETYVDNYNLALDMTTANTTFVAGHGQLWKRDRLIAVRDIMTTVHARFRDMVARGMTLEQIAEARPSREFDDEFGAAPNVTVESWYRSLYDEVSAEVAARR